MDPTNSSMLSIGFSLFVVIINFLNLVMDFDFIEEQRTRISKIYGMVRVWITGYFSVVVFGNSSITKSKIKFKRLKKGGIINPSFFI